MEAKSKPWVKVEKELPGNGFNLSEDYELLWTLINQGRRVPGWIVYSLEFEEPIYDLVEIKMRKDYMIGTRGMGYEGLTNTLESFKKRCQKLHLRFILPSNI
jgi:hypothetical protein